MCMLVACICYMSILFSNKIRTTLADRTRRACWRKHILCCEFVCPSGWGNIFCHPNNWSHMLKGSNRWMFKPLPWWPYALPSTASQCNTTLVTNIHFSAGAHLTFRMLHGYFLFLYIGHHVSCVFSHKPHFLTYMCQHICAFRSCFSHARILRVRVTKLQ